jgi:hypothetical protein
MSIRAYLDREGFDPETARLKGLASAMNVRQSARGHDQAAIRKARECRDCGDCAHLALVFSCAWRASTPHQYA